MSAQTKRKHRLSVPEVGAQKRVHRDDEGDVDADDLDLEKQAAKQTQPGRHGRVVTEGFDSDEDESDDEADYRKRWRAGDDAGNDEEDMFGCGGEPSKADTRTKSEPKYLRLADIDGQEFGSRTRVQDEDEDDSGEDDEAVEDRDPEYELERANAATDYTDANADAECTPPASPGGSGQNTRKEKVQQKRKSGMGFKIDKFNMKSEMAGGRFDEEGNYIWNAKDPFAQSDRWLEGNYSKKQIRAASEAKDKREQAAREQEARTHSAYPTAAHAMKALAECLEPGQSVLEALQKAGAGAKGRRNAKASDLLSEITQLTSLLMSTFGLMNIYDDTYEALVRHARRAELVPPDWDPKRPAMDEKEADSADERALQSQWEYKWSPSYLTTVGDGNADAGAAAQTFGPFAEQDLLSWAKQGYFGPGNENIEVRRAGSDSAWSTWQEAGL